MDAFLSITRTAFVRLPVLRPPPAQRVDSTLSTARAGGRFLWQLPQAVPGKPGYPARYRRAVPEMGDESGAEVGRSDRGGSPRPARRVRRALLQAGQT